MKLLRQINWRNPHFPLPPRRKQHGKKTDPATANITWQGGSGVQRVCKEIEDRERNSRLSDGGATSRRKRPSLLTGPSAKVRGVRGREMKGFFLPALEIGQSTASSPAVEDFFLWNFRLTVLRGCSEKSLVVRTRILGLRWRCSSHHDHKVVQWP